MAQANNCYNAQINIKSQQTSHYSHANVLVCLKALTCESLSPTNHMTIVSNMDSSYNILSPHSDMSRSTNSEKLTYNISRKTCIIYIKITKIYIT